MASSRALSFPDDGFDSFSIPAIPRNTGEFEAKWLLPGGLFSFAFKPQWNSDLIEASIPILNIFKKSVP